MTYRVTIGLFLEGLVGRKKLLLRRVVLSEGTELPLLIYLWKFRVGTTKALSESFYSERSVKRAYDRLRVLEKAGYILSRCNTLGNKWVWLLSRRGYEVVRLHVPGIEHEGFGSAQIAHDLVSAAFHIGELFPVNKTGIKLVTEQEIKRYNFEVLADKLELPEKEGWNHRPDGLWHYREVPNSKLVAMEIQITRQKRKDYQRVGFFYKRNKHVIGKVLWLVHDKPMITSLRNGLSLAYEPSEEAYLNAHQFVTFPHFFELGWRAPILKGSFEGHTILDLMLTPLPVNVSSPLGNVPSVSQKYLLDVRKAPHSAKNELFYKPGDQW